MVALYARIALAVLMMGLAVVWSSECEGQEERGGIIYDSPRGGHLGLKGRVRLYERSHAVVIGINAYKGRYKLRGAVPDALAVATALLSQGFPVENITLLLDHGDTKRLRRQLRKLGLARVRVLPATRRRIRQVIGEELTRDCAKGPGAYCVGHDDRVLVYYAGHGETLGNDAHAKGYLMPVDVDFASPSVGGVSMSEIQDWLQISPSKHILFVADACYSGLALPAATTRSALSKEVSDYALKITQRRVRMTLVAGRQGDLAHEWKEHGVFTYFLLQALQGEADANNDGLITGNELAAFIQPNVTMTVSAEFKANQQPLLGRRGEGEFIFLNPERGGEYTPDVGADRPIITVPYEEEGSSGMAIAAWSALGLSVAALGATGGIFLSYQDDADERDRIRPAPGNTFPDNETQTRFNALESLIDERETMALVSLGVAGAALATGITLFFLDNDDTQSNDKTAAQGVQLNLSPAGLVLEGTF